MKITPKYCRVEWNHLHTFQSWQSHPIKSTPHSHPNYSLVSCTKMYPKQGIWIDFACFMACIPLLSLSSDLQHTLLLPPSMSSGPLSHMPACLFTISQIHCLVASCHHTHSKSKDICPLCPYRRLPTYPIHSLHSCIQCHSCPRLNNGLMIVDRSSHSTCNIRPTFRESTETF